jgi:hypothetical protein
VNHNTCHFAAQRRFGLETSTPKRVRFPAAPQKGRTSAALFVLIIGLAPALPSTSRGYDPGYDIPGMASLRTGTRKDATKYVLATVLPIRRTQLLAGGGPFAEEGAKTRGAQG